VKARYPLGESNADIHVEARLRSQRSLLVWSDGLRGGGHVKPEGMVIRAIQQGGSAKRVAAEAGSSNGDAAGNGQPAPTRDR